MQNTVAIATAKPLAQVGVLRQYFGYLPGQSLKDFATEVHRLSADQKLELARGAARELGLEQDQVTFPL